MYTFTKEKSILAKAFLPFLIIFHHSSILPHMHYFVYLGITVVSWFFLISGYGLVFSYSNRGGYISTFLSNRFPKILIPYFISVSIKYLCNIIFSGYHPTYILEHGNLVDLLFSNWFVDVIIADYIIFYIIFRLSPSNIKANITTILMLSILYYIVCNHFNVPRYWYGSQLGFPLGMFWAYKEGEIRNLMKRKMILPMSMLLLIMTLAVSHYYSIKFLTPVIVSAFYIILMYSFLCDHIHSKFIIFLSSISFELYLYHQIFIRLFVDKIEVDNTAITLLLIVTCTIIISWLAHKLAIPIIASLKR